MGKVIVRAAVAQCVSWCFASQRYATATILSQANTLRQVRRQNKLPMVVKMQLGLIVCLTLFGAAQVRAAAITYDVDVLSFISGTITTDGNITTPLSASDITNWQINQTMDTVHFPSGMNPSNSTVSLAPGALTATATALLFNFSDTVGSKLEFSSTAFPGNNLQYCDAVNACINQVSASDFSTIEYVFVAPGCCSTSAGSAESGIVQIAIATSSSPTPTPEPDALLLFGAGLGVIGLLGWRRKGRRLL